MIERCARYRRSWLHTIIPSSAELRDLRISVPLGRPGAGMGRVRRPIPAPKDAESMHGSVAGLSPRGDAPQNIADQRQARHGQADVLGALDQIAENLIDLDRAASYYIVCHRRICLRPPA